MAGDLELPDEPLEFVLRIWLEEGNGASFCAAASRRSKAGLVHFQDGPALLRFLNARVIARNGIALARGQAGGESQ
jgi:hypothetical protein